MLRYDVNQTFRWNYDRAPGTVPSPAVLPISGSWTFCGRPISSPLGIAAGPLLNGRWVLYYAALGFDVLTYKTVRSAARECYTPPNLQPVRTGPLRASGTSLPVSNLMEGSWAISMGMPSMPPEIWRADVERTRAQLPAEKLLCVSVVATPEPEWTLDDLADDFARCARWAVESGADCVETNFSCPNVSTADGQLYQQPKCAAIVAHRVRAAIGATPFVIKLGFFDDLERVEQMTEALGSIADAWAMTNCIAARVHDQNGKPSFGGEARGIGGAAIRAASIAQVRQFSAAIRQRELPTRLIGVGGISEASHAQEYLEAGAEAVQLSTAVMFDPLVGCRIREDWRSF